MCGCGLAVCRERQAFLELVDHRIEGNATAHRESTWKLCDNVLYPKSLAPVHELDDLYKCGPFHKQRMRARVGMTVLEIRRGLVERTAPMKSCGLSDSTIRVQLEEG